MAFEIKIPAFEKGQTIPTEYTCDGADLSPDIQWSGAPENTKSYVLICDDPDAPMGTWVHWVVYNIPANQSKVEKGKKPNGVEGKNSWGRRHYGGPCPPPPTGEHRYYFKLYALDSELPLEKGAGKAEVEKSMKGHVLASTTWMGRYSRTSK